MKYVYLQKRVAQPGDEVVEELQIRDEILKLTDVRKQ